MAEKESGSIIVIKRKKGGHAGHHGGAWKVAYADFVTAMMCFFLVMWLMGAEDEVKQQIASYFNNPNQVYKGSDSVNRDGQLAGGDASNRNDGSSGKYEESQLSNPSHSVPVYIEEKTILDDIASVFPYEGSAFSRDTEADILKFVVPGQVYFDLGSVNITNENHAYLNKVGAILKNYKGSVVIEGHAEKEEITGKGTDQWVLSFGRAMSVRNYLIQNANISPDKLIPTVSYFSKIDPSIEKKIKSGRFVNFILKHSRK